MRPIRPSSHRSTPKPGQNRVFKSPNQLSPRMLWGEQRLAEITEQTPSIERSNRGRLVLPTSVSSFTRAADDGSTLGLTVVTPAETVEGDTLLLTVIAVGWEDDPLSSFTAPSGWTLVASFDLAGQLAFSSGSSSWRALAKTATSGDASGGGSYPYSAAFPNPSDLDRMEHHCVAIPATLSVGSATDDASVSDGTVAADAGNAAGPSVVLAHAWNTSNSGSRDVSTPTLDLPVTTLGSDATYGQSRTAVGTVEAGGNVSGSASETGTTDALAGLGLVVLPLA